MTFNLLERDDDRLMQALDFAGLGQFVKAHPRGLDLELADGGAGLSIGGLSAALVAEPFGLFAG